MKTEIPKPLQNPNEQEFPGQKTPPVPGSEKKPGDEEDTPEEI
jgi:hypothetical protein